MSASRSTGRAPARPPNDGPPAAQGFDAPLSQQALEKALGTLGSVRVEVTDQTGSTNDDLLELARLSTPDRPVVRAALHQVAGRGRHGRRWHDARGRALLFSVMTPWSREPAGAPAVTVACGIATAEVLRGHGIEVKLKWPNDLLLSGRKLGGILTELAFDPQGRASLVVGVGLNLCLDPETRVAIDQPTAALDERIVESRLAAEREGWIGALALAMLDAIGRFEQEGFAPFRDRFEALFAYAGRPVVLMQAGQPDLAGVPAGIDADGRLLLSTEAGVQAVTSGELSLRPADA